jgi:hypothetical protein
VHDYEVIPGFSDDKPGKNSCLIFQYVGVIIFTYSDVIYVFTLIRVLDALHSYTDCTEMAGK